MRQIVGVAAARSASAAPSSGSGTGVAAAAGPNCQIPSPGLRPKAGAVARMAKLFESKSETEESTARPWRLCASPATLTKALLAPLPPDGDDDAALASPRPAHSTSCTREEASSSRMSSTDQEVQQARQVPRATYPPLPLPSLLSRRRSSTSSKLSSIAALWAASAPVERQLWPGSSRCSDPQAREALLAKIRARFGTKRLLPARQLPPGELLCQLGGAHESDLSPRDYEFHRWDAMPIQLSQTNNAAAKNWVLTGQSGCVGLACSLLHIFVLGAGQTIFMEDMDQVQAGLDEVGMYVRLGGDGFLTLKVPDASEAEDMVGAINHLAARRAALRARYHTPRPFGQTPRSECSTARSYQGAATPSSALGTPRS